mmetsp:Transcript_18907/g.43972  ORF Transcript_18907/g.43972 Transcript_18907/m.43972 type:complete len:333 (+) Transcript_18907:64-1062(+)
MWPHHRGPHGYGPPDMRALPLAPYPEGAYAYPSHSKMQECDDECAEEECNRDICGDEHQPPREGEQFCGLDIRPLLPIALSLSTVLGAACMLGVQLLLLTLKIGLYAIIFYVIFGLIYLMTLVCMAYATWCDPGQLRRDQHQAFADLEASRTGQAPVGDALPRRCQKTWLYKRPLRRYDHYCRWLCNCIALMNHREFILMCMGLVISGFLSLIMDVVMFFLVLGQWWAMALILLHFIYSGILLWLVGPIAKVHIGLVARNELAAEWKRNDFYVVSKAGTIMSVTELADDEYNELFDQFMYDRKRNPFDRGFSQNCTSFWCTARWTSEQLGDF